MAQYAATDLDRAGRVIGLVMQVSWGTVLLASVVSISASSLIASRVLDTLLVEALLVER